MASAVSVSRVTVPAPAWMPYYPAAAPAEGSARPHGKRRFRNRLRLQGGDIGVADATDPWRRTAGHTLVQPVNRVRVHHGRGGARPDQQGDDAGGDQRPAARPAKILLDLISRVRAYARISPGVREPDFGPAGEPRGSGSILSSQSSGSGSGRPADMSSAERRLNGTAAAHRPADAAAPRGGGGGTGVAAGRRRATGSRTSAGSGSGARAKLSCNG